MSKTTDKHKARTEKSSKGARYLRRVLYFTVALSLILLVLPYIIRYELMDALRDAGAESVRIADIDYNPFTAVISIKHLLIKNDQKISLRVSNMQLDVESFPILRRRLIINTATLQDAEVFIEQDAQGKLTIAGFTIPGNEISSEADDNIWHTGIESLTLANTDVNIRINKQDHLLQIDNAKLEKLHTWEADNKAQLTFNGMLNDAKLELDINLSLFGDTLDVSGRMHLDTLELNPIMPDLYGQLTVTGNTAIKLEQQGRLTISHEGDFILTNAKYSHPELVFSASDMTITGKNSLTLDTGPSGDGQVKLAHTGSLAVNQSSFIQPVHKIELLRFNKLHAKRINIQSRNQIELAEIKLTQTSLLRDSQSDDSTPMARSELITIDQIKLDNMDTLRLGNIIIDQLQLAIKRDKQGALIPLGRMLTEQQTETPQAPEADTTNIHPTGFKIKLDSLTITGDSNVQIDDESVQPGYHSRLQIKKAELGKLDNTQAQQPTSLLIELLPAKFGSVKLSGNVYPFTPEHDLDLSLTAKSISLPRLSPYLSHYTGYKFRQGQLDSDSTFKTVNGELTGQINVVARKLEMAPVSTEKANQIRKQLGMPLEEALAMLRDSDNNIKLNIPVSGNLSNPDFSLGNVINIAITSAIKSGASSYLLYALGPYGIALALADRAISSGGYIQLSDITYEAGKTVFPDDVQDYLQRLQKITLDRPEVELHLCARATEQDRQALRDTSNTQNITQDQQTDTLPDDAAILALAEQRMVMLKDILTKKYAVKPERIILCTPAIDANKQAIPRVEVSL